MTENTPTSILLISLCLNILNVMFCLLVLHRSIKKRKKVNCCVFCWYAGIKLYWFGYGISDFFSFLTNSLNWIACLSKWIQKWQSKRHYSNYFIFCQYLLMIKICTNSVFKASIFAISQSRRLQWLEKRSDMSRWHFYICRPLDACTSRRSLLNGYDVTAK